MKIQSSRKISNKKITGQGMSEYLVIVGLLAVAGIATMGFMGNSVRGVFGSFSNELSGTSGTAAKTKAQTQAGLGVTNSNASLQNYDTRSTTLANQQ